MRGFFLEKIMVNEEQRAAGDKFLDFMLSNKKHFFIFGTAGTGKSYLLNYIKDEVLPKLDTASKLLGKGLFDYTVYFTATTHKACAELESKVHADVQTIYSLFGLVVKDDHFSGETYLSSTSSYVFDKALIFIDECSMLSYKALETINARTANSKIVFIGDPWQLPAVKDPIHWIVKDSPESCILTKQMRAKKPYLVNLIKELQQNVISHSPVHICYSPDCFYRLDSGSMQEDLDRNFRRGLNCKILAFTNKICMEYQEWLNNRLNRQSIYDVNTPVIVNSTLQNFSENSVLFYPDMEVEVSRVKTAWQKCPFPISSVTVKAPGRPVVECVAADNPLDRLTHLKKYAKEKDWRNYFWIKNHVLDLRFGDAITIHKAQGSSYDIVYLDLNSFACCPSLDMALRLLYVAVSRAREKVVLYGNFPRRFGEIHV